jgi:hypothetical protein
VGNIHYIEYLYEIQKGEEIRRYVTQQFRSQNRDLPAATRLRNVIKSAAGTGGPISLHGEHVYNLDYTLNMRQAPAGPNRSEEGYQQNGQWFWEQMLQRYPKLFDEENRKLILVDKSAPIVNDQWLRFFPMHASDRRQRLHHHHLGRGPIATPIPEQPHKKQKKLPEKR